MPEQQNIEYKQSCLYSVRALDRHSGLQTLQPYLRKTKNRPGG